MLVCIGVFCGTLFIRVWKHGSVLIKQLGNRFQIGFLGNGYAAGVTSVVVFSGVAYIVNEIRDKVVEDLNIENKEDEKNCKDCD